MLDGNLGFWVAITMANSAGSWGLGVELRFGYFLRWRRRKVRNLIMPAWALKEERLAIGIEASVDEPDCCE